MASTVANRAETRCIRQQFISVDDPVLASKITMPRVPGWAVPRPRINELMARGGRWSPLTVLTGPPGAGKTMALALWAAADHGAVAWVTLDDYDNQPRVFWSYVVAALHRAGVAVPGGLPGAVPEEAVGHVFLRRLVSALAAQDVPVTLIIDDLHLLTESRVLDSLDYVLRNAGSALRLVVTSRVDPLLPLHRYRLAGADRDPVRRPGPQHPRNRPAHGSAWHRAVRRLAGVPYPANGGLGGRHPPRRDLDGHPSRS